MAVSVKSLVFSEKEKLYLLELIRRFPIVESRKTDVGTIGIKKRAWEEIYKIFNSSGNFQKRSLAQLRKHWDNVKSRRKKEKGEETRELMSTGGGPYKPHKPSCPEVEVVSPHIDYPLCYEWDRDAVTMENAAAKRHQISISDVTAALRSPGSTFAGTTLLEYLNTTRFPNYKQCQPASAITHTRSSSLSQPFHITSSSLGPSPSPPPPLSHSLSLSLSTQPPPPPLLSPSPALTRPGLLKRTLRAHEEREKVWLEEGKELDNERLAEAKLNHKEAIRRHQRAEELHLLKVERHRVKLALETRLMEANVRQAEAEAQHQAELCSFALQAAKEKHRAQLQKLLGPVRAATSSVSSPCFPSETSHFPN